MELPPELRDGLLSVRGVARGVSRVGLSVRGMEGELFLGVGVLSRRGASVFGFVVRDGSRMGGAVFNKSRFGKVSLGVVSPGLARFVSLRGFEAV